MHPTAKSRAQTLAILATLVGTAAATALLTATPASASLADPSAGSSPDIAPSAQVADPHWVAKPTGSSQQFRGLDAVDVSTAWVGGSDGQVLRTTDGGASWQDVSPEGTDGLLFRDVEAIDDRRASVMAIGEGDASRIYTTTDGGESWTLAFVNDDPRAFYNCMDFWPGGLRGIAVSDPVDSKFRIIRTEDGGMTWRVLPSDGMPPAVEGEYNFAASGTCLVTAGGRDAWMASGAAASRIFHTQDQGLTWTVTESSIPATAAGGVFSLDFRGLRHGIAVGGDFLEPDIGVDASAVTDDGGASWANGGDLSGYRSGVAWVSGTRATAVAVGPTGSDITYDGGASWTRFDATDLDAVDCTADRACWASGRDGTVAVLAW